MMRAGIVATIIQMTEASQLASLHANRSTEARSFLNVRFVRNDGERRACGKPHYQTKQDVRESGKREERK